jgi:hypothetical protein
MKKRKNIEPLVNLLKASYKQQFPPDFPQNWHEDILREIEEIGRPGLHPKSSWLERMFPPPAIFRFAGAAAAFALALVIFFLTSGGEGINQAFARLLFKDPLGGLSLLLLSL